MALLRVATGAAAPGALSRRLGCHDRGRPLQAFEQGRAGTGPQPADTSQVWRLDQSLSKVATADCRATLSIIVESKVLVVDRRTAIAPVEPIFILHASQFIGPRDHRRNPDVGRRPSAFRAAARRHPRPGPWTGRQAARRR